MAACRCRKMGDVLMKYRDEIVKSMKLLSENEKTIFIGQSVGCPGTEVYKTLNDAGVPENKRIELPVFEDTQMGMSIGLALEGYVPISIFPRFNFLFLAVNQLVNHLDKIPIISKGSMKPKVIIRVLVGSERPLDPGVQHKGDFTDAFKLLLKTVEVVRLENPEDI